MPEVIVTYKKPETLKVLKSLAKYFDFKVSSAKSKENLGDILIPGDKALDISVLSAVFKDKNLDAKELREKAWKRAR
jgi:hypothetical protein